MAKRDRSQTLRWLSDRTERRREDRGRRKRTMLAIIGSMLVMLVLALPSLLTHSPVIHSLVDSFFKPYGWKVKVETISIGWISPLRLKGIDAIGPSGETMVVAEALDAQLTVMDLLSGKTDWGTITVDGPRLESKIYEGGSRLEDDLQPFLEAPASSSEFSATIELRDAVAKLTYVDTGLDDASQTNSVTSISAPSWRIDQLQAKATITGGLINFNADGVLTDPEGISGALSTEVAFSEKGDAVDITMRSEGLPLSIIGLAAIRFPETSDSLPQAWSGNATGRLNIQVLDDGAFAFTVDPMDLRNLVILDQGITGEKAWKVGHAIINGSARLEGESLRFEQFTIKSDAGDVSMDGVVDLAAVSSGQYLNAMLGDFGTEFDLALLTEAAPGLIPLRGDVAVRSGRVKAEVHGEYGADEAFRTSLKLNSQPITAVVAGGQTIVLQPVTADVVLKPSRNWISAEKLLIKSSFGEATASGDLRGGQASFNLDFERLAGTLRSLLDLPPASLGGVARGNIQWAVINDQVWKLEGNASTKDLLIAFPGMQPVRRPAMDVVIRGEGVWSEGQLTQLKQATLQLSEPQQQWTLSLLEQVDRPSGDSLFPVRLQGRGDLQTLTMLASGLLPSSIQYLEGNVEADLICNVSTNRGHLSKADIAISEFSIVVDNQLYHQDAIKAHFEGTYLWPENALRADTFTVSGNAASFVLQGDVGPGLTEIELAYRADLQRLSDAIIMPQPAPPQEGVSFVGAVEGKVELSGDKSDQLNVVVSSEAKNVMILLPAERGEPQILWQEPQINAQANLVWTADLNTLVVSRFVASAPWLNTELAGSLKFSETGHEATLEGPAEFNVSTVSSQLTTLLGEPIRMTGKHKTPVRITIAKRGDANEQVDITGSIGWDTAQVSGVTAGAADVPLRITEDTIIVDRSSIPIQQGVVHLAGKVHYQAQPLSFEQQPGTFAEGITLTPDMCRGWLKYMLPIAADTADVNGAFSLDLAECRVIPSDPVASKVTGTLRVEGATIGPGPLTRGLIATIDQLEAASKGLQGQLVPSENGPKQWIRLDPQAVDFSLAGGQVTHQRMQMRVGKASLISSGSVFLDGRLNLRFQLPLESSWLGSDLAGLAGRPITLPVGGTLSRPVVDNQAVVNTLAQLGTQAIQTNAENYLQKQLDRQWQKLFKN